MMKFACILAGTFLVFASDVLTSEEDVLEFTDDDFDTRIKGEDLALVEFFAPWCGHCKRLIPEYEKAAEMLKKNDPPVPLIKVDCIANTKVCGKYGVSGYPTLKIFRNGEVSEDYNGPREADGIFKMMKSKAGPSSKPLETVADTEKFLSDKDHSVIGFFSDETSDIAKQFKKAADSLSENFRFAHTTNTDVLEKYGYKEDVVIFQPKRLQSKLEKSTVKYDDDAALHKIKTWVNENIHGLCGHRTSDNAGQFKKPLVVAYYEVDYIKNPKGTNYWRNRVMKVAKKFADKKVNFAVSNADDFRNELSEFGLDKTLGDKPVVTARGAKDEKFVMSEEFSVETLEQFANDFVNDKLEAYLKSEPIPEDNDGPVKVVVAKTFEDIVNNPEKDVLIEFYAPWCGHCKSLEPKFLELAEKLANDEGITIAKMDATANDVPSAFNVRGFPTIYYAPKGNKANPKQYEGGREVDDFIQYLAKESTDPLKGWDRKGKEQKSEL